MERFRLEHDEQASDTIARRDAVGEFQVLGEPGLAMFGPSVDSGGAIAPADDPTDRDDGDIGESVFAIARMAWVGERFEVGADGGDIDELWHGKRPEFGGIGAP